MDDLFRTHIEIFDSRLKSLGKHYESLQKENNKLDEDFDYYSHLRSNIEEQMKKRLDDVDEKYSEKIQELTAQHDLFTQMYNKREEEHRCLQNYLKSNEQQQNNTTGRHILEKSTLVEQLCSKSARDKNKIFTEKLNNLEKLSREQLQQFYQLMNVFKLSHESVQQITSYKNLYERAKNLQELTIERLQKETNQLNLVIAQSSLGESTSDVVFSNVRANCKVINSINDDSTLSTLTKHLDKQRKIIKLLTHKQTITARENDLLTVENQRTQDLTRYYTNIISKANEGQYVDVQFLD